MQYFIVSTKSVSSQIWRTCDSTDLTPTLKWQRYNRIIISQAAPLFEVKAIINNRVIKQHDIVQSMFCADGKKNARKKKRKELREIFGGLERGLHFPKSSIILLLFCACWASCSALDISIISRSRWKVRSRDIGGSSDLRPLSIDSSPLSPKPLMSALMFLTFPCKRRRVSWSCNALL